MQCVQCHVQRTRRFTLSTQPCEQGSVPPQRCKGLVSGVRERTGGVGEGDVIQVKENEMVRCHLAFLQSGYWVNCFASTVIKRSDSQTLHRI